MRNTGGKTIESIPIVHACIVPASRQSHYGSFGFGKGQKKQLVELGADALAEALMQLADHSDIADEMLERMIATPKENVKRFKAKLAGIKRSRKFMHRSESAGYARRLENLLNDLKSGVDDPRAGVELVISFYKADNKIFGNCDDSNGSIGDVFRYEAKRIFVEYASRCEDKKWLGERVLALNREDNFGVRDSLIDCAAEYLSESIIRVMISHMQDNADQESDVYKKRHWLSYVESLAR